MFFNPLFIDTSSVGTTQNLKNSKLGKSQYLFSDIIKISLSQNNSSDTETAPAYNLSLINTDVDIKSVFTASSDSKKSVSGKIDDTKSDNSLIAGFLQYAFNEQKITLPENSSLGNILKKDGIVLTKETLTSALSHLLQLYQPSSEKDVNSKSGSTSSEELAGQILTSLDEKGKVTVNFDNNSSQIKVELTKLDSRQKDLFFSANIIPISSYDNPNGTASKGTKPISSNTSTETEDSNIPTTVISSLNTGSSVQPVVAGNYQLPDLNYSNAQQAIPDSEGKIPVVQDKGTKENYVSLNQEFNVQGREQIDSSINSNAIEITGFVPLNEATAKPGSTLLDSVDTSNINKTKTNTQINVQNSNPVVPESEKQNNSGDYNLRVWEVNSPNAEKDSELKNFTLSSLEKNLLKKSTIFYSSDTDNRKVNIQNNLSQSINQFKSGTAATTNSSNTSIPEADVKVLKSNDLLISTNTGIKNVYVKSDNNGSLEQVKNSSINELNEPVLKQNYKTISPEIAIETKSKDIAAEVKTPIVGKVNTNIQSDISLQPDSMEEVQVEKVQTAQNPDVVIENENLMPQNVINTEQQPVELINIAQNNKPVSPDVDSGIKPTVQFDSENIKPQIQNIEKTDQSVNISIKENTKSDNKEYTIVDNSDSSQIKVMDDQSILTGINPKPEDLKITSSYAAPEQENVKPVLIDAEPKLDNVKTVLSGAESKQNNANSQLNDTEPKQDNVKAVLRETESKQTNVKSILNDVQPTKEDSKSDIRINEFVKLNPDEKNLTDTLKFETNAKIIGVNKEELPAQQNSDILKTEQTAAKVSEPEIVVADEKLNVQTQLSEEGSANNNIKDYTQPKTNITTEPVSKDIVINDANNTADLKNDYQTAENNVEVKTDKNIEVKQDIKEFVIESKPDAIKSEQDSTQKISQPSEPVVKDSAATAELNVNETSYVTPALIDDTQEKLQSGGVVVNYAKEENNEVLAKTEMVEMPEVKQVISKKANIATDTEEKTIPEKQEVKTEYGKSILSSISSKKVSSRQNNVNKSENSGTSANEKSTDKQLNVSEKKNPVEKTLTQDTSKPEKLNMPIEDNTQKKIEVTKDSDSAIKGNDTKVNAQDEKSSLNQNSDADKKSSDDSSKLSSSDKKNIKNDTFAILNSTDKDKTTIVKDVTAGSTAKTSDVNKTIKAYEIIKELKGFIEQGNKNSLVLKIIPDNLGSVKISLDMVKNSVQARIDVDTESVKQFVQSNLDTLKQTFVQSGLNLSSLSVNLSTSEQKQQGSAAASGKKKYSNLKSDDDDTEVESAASTKKLGYNSYDYIA